MNAEETPGGLLIVRAPESMPHSQNTAHTKRVASQPPPSYPSGAGPSKPPSKKFRADSQPPPAARSSTLTTLHDDPQLEQDVRAMEDEADHLRRNSRAHTTIDPAFNPAFQFPPRAESSTTKGKGKSMIVDTTIAIPERETPKIERNKQLREGAMAAIANGRSSRPLEQNGKEQGQGHRRKSSVSGRGKRISSSFSTTGVIGVFSPPFWHSRNMTRISVQPHNSVADTSFYKHIDCDLPEVERIRTLLIWCSLRAAGISGSNGTSSSKSKPRPSSTEPPPPPLPPLSDKAAQLLKTVQEDYIRMLAEKKIDLSLFPQASNGNTTEVLRDNEQNVRNRLCEVVYSENIQRYVQLLC
jgi:kinetochore protein Mis13/DSN1